MKAGFMALVMVLALSVAAAAADLPKVKVETTAGNFVIELDSRKAPKTVRNFVVYVNPAFMTVRFFTALFLALSSREADSMPA